MAPAHSNPLCVGAVFFLEFTTLIVSHHSRTRRPGRQLSGLDRIHPIRCTEIAPRPGSSGARSLAAMPPVAVFHHRGGRVFGFRAWGSRRARPVGGVSANHHPATIGSEEDPELIVPTDDGLHEIQGSGGSDDLKRSKLVRS